MERPRSTQQPPRWNPSAARLGSASQASLSLKSRPSTTALPAKIGWGGSKTVEGGSLVTLSSSYSVGAMSGGTQKKSVSSPFVATASYWSKDLRKYALALADG